MAGPSTTKEEIVAFFVGKGWKPHHGFGIAANIFKESSFRHRARGDGGKAIGLCQWHGDRQRVFASRFGKVLEEASVQEQLEFIHHELTHNEKAAGAKLRATKTAREAGAVISRFYERPKLVEIEMQRRGDLAQQWHDEHAAKIAAAAKAPGAG